METKNSIRKQILTLRSQMKPVQQTSKSRAIVQKVLEIPDLQNAEHILCYAGYQSEVLTEELIEALLKQQKCIWLPRVNGEEMDFYQIQSMEDLVCGYKNIPEPSILCQKKFPKEFDTKAVMIMPGCVFAKDGSRIGYGKGYYDRYLEKHNLQIRIALCFTLQLVDKIPTDFHDKKASVLVTEDEIIMVNE